MKDFMTQDPKPNLSRAAIECNIEYYRARGAEYSQQYRLALEEETHWIRELIKLKAQDAVPHNTR